MVAGIVRVCAASRAQRPCTELGIDRQLFCLHFHCAQVLKQTKEVVGRALATRPATLEALRAKLRLEPL